MRFSEVANKIGVSLAVDNLTASKFRLTVAMICVQIDQHTTLPNTITILVEGRKFL